MFLDEIAALLADKGVGTIGTDIFLGSKAVIPKTSGPFLSLIETGGSGPTRVQNEPGAHTQRPSAQVLVRAKSYIEARRMIKNAYDVLDGVFNTVLSTTFYQKIVAMQEPTDLGQQDANGRVMIVFNIDVEKQPS